MINRRNFIRMLGILGMGVAAAPVLALNQAIKPVGPNANDIEWAPAEIGKATGGIIYEDIGDWKQGPIFLGDGDDVKVSWDSKGVFLLDD